MFEKKLKPTPSSILLVGLGNPGSKHENHRHNIGFMILDQIIADYNFTKSKKTFGGELTEGKIDGQKVFLLKPLTFMNLSGESVGKAASFYKIPPENIIVFHDELDLAVGKLRVKKGGGAGGHNGLKSIDSHMGKDYWRVRIGIDHPGDKNRVSGYVLSDFSKAEKSEIENVIYEVARNVELLLPEDKDAFMNKVSIRIQDIS